MSTWGFLSTRRPAWEMHPCSRSYRRPTPNVYNRIRRRDQSHRSDHCRRSASSTNFKASRTSPLCSRPKILTRFLRRGRRTKVTCHSRVTRTAPDSSSNWRMPVIWEKGQSRAITPSASKRWHRSRKSGQIWRVCSASLQINPAPDTSESSCPFSCKCRGHRSLTIICMRSWSRPVSKLGIRHRKPIHLSLGFCLRSHFSLKIKSRQLWTLFVALWRSTSKLLLTQLACADLSSSSRFKIKNA